MTGRHAEVVYPLFAYEKDDCSMRIIESADRLLYKLEAVDIENDEYAFWDANGEGVRITISNNEVSTISPGKQPLTLREAFTAYIESLDLPDSLIHGTPTEIWTRVEAELASGPKRSWFSKLFRHC